MGDPFEELIARHVELWFRWLESDKRVRDASLCMADRRKAAEECEKIVNEKYKNIAQMDRYIDELKRS